MFRARIESTSLALLLLLVGAFAGDPLSHPSLTAAQVARIKSLVANMTLAEKIGQMTQGERTTVSTSQVSQYFLGSVLSGGGSVPGSGYSADFAALYNQYQAAALSTRLAIPLIYGQDAVHGVNNVKDTTMFPHNIGLGAANDTDLTEEIGKAAAEELLASGTTWTFAPCVAVARDDRWGRTYESFGESPDLVARLSKAMVDGLQANGLVQACSKHYLGDGGTSWGTGSIGYSIDQGNTICDIATLRDTHMRGYNVTADNVATVMVSFSSWNGLKMTANKYLITDVLKGEMGFAGLVVTDWDAITQLDGNAYEQVVTAINAGIDMAMVPYQWVNFTITLKQAVDSSDVSIDRINDAVTRILAVKERFGLFDQPYYNSSYSSMPGSHRALARKAVQKSLVLLKNDNNTLPLKKKSSIFVGGKSANNLGYQCGGWSLNWQGFSGNTGTSGTTIYQGISDIVTNASGQVDFSSSGSGADGNDVAILVVGETPYAEGKGDVSSLDLDSTDQSAINTVYSTGVPIVLVIVSGRPLVIPSDILAKVKAIVAAWYPGTEGRGVADVLFGDAAFSGKLPVSWPHNTSQEPINVGDSTYEPLFPFGFGLTATASSESAQQIDASSEGETPVQSSTSPVQQSSEIPVQTISSSHFSDCTRTAVALASLVLLAFRLFI